MVYPVLVAVAFHFSPSASAEWIFELVETRTFSSRVVYLRYRAAR
jgi:hypothetical protein